MPIIFSKQYAEVVRRLREQGVASSDPLLRAKFQNAFSIVLGGSVAQRSSQINIVLPDLDDNVQADISKDNVLAVCAIYFAAQLEELKLFAVAEKVSEQFMQQQVPISRGVGGEAIYHFIKDAPNRLTEPERKGLYARTFGFAQGAVEEPMPNREFADLWIRFLSAVSVLNRENAITVPRSLTAEQTFKNARDLAVNLSLHGYGVAHFAAVELQDLVTTVIKMLSFPDVLASYGVTDIWQLVERVSGLYLGGAVNGVRQRTLAQSGARIIQWLANKQPYLVGGSPGRGGQFNDENLVADVERWLAVTGTDDSSIQKYSEVVSMPSQPTIPSLSLSALPDTIANLTQGPGIIQNAMHNLAAVAPNGKA